jgi:hypothetical protein
MADDKVKDNIPPTGLMVSYSAIDTYLSCSEKYRLERILKIVPESINTAFMFGKAIDDASEVIFKPFMKGGSPFKRKDMLDRFKERLTTIDYQGEDIHAPTCVKVKYSKADVQSELLEKEDLKVIQDFIDKSDLEVTNIQDFIDYYKDSKIKVEDETSIYNFIAWYCLYRKGVMMLDRLKLWADENILEVTSLQRKIEIENDFGDKLIGYLDLEATLKRDGILRTLDLKTATNAVKQYPDDKIANSDQLTIYANSTQKQVGYVIIDKEIKKKEPRVRIRELYGEITEEQLDTVFEKIDFAMEGIRAEKFEKNTDACFKFGKCWAYELCHRGNMKGLIPRVKRNENGN